MRDKNRLELAQIETRFDRARKHIALADAAVDQYAFPSCDVLDKGGISLAAAGKDVKTKPRVGAWRSSKSLLKSRPVAPLFFYLLAA